MLIHGWACDRSYMAPQLEHFARSHRVVAVDLRGHGESDAPPGDYSMAAMAQDVAWLCRQLELPRPVLVGHSLGGVVALELLRLEPDLPAAIVALDCPIVLAESTHGAIRSATEPLRGPAYREAVRQFVTGMFLPNDDAARKARIVAAMSSGPEHVGVAAMDGMLACPSALASTAPPIGVPLLAIASAGGHMADLSRLRELCPRLMLAQTAGAGHFHQLEVPDQVNAMIERFLRTLG